MKTEEKIIIGVAGIVVVGGVCLILYNHNLTMKLGTNPASANPSSGAQTPAQQLQGEINRILNSSDWADQRSSWKSANYGTDDAEIVVWDAALEAGGGSAVLGNPQRQNFNFPNIQSIVGSGTTTSGGGTSPSGGSSTGSKIVTGIEDVISIGASLF